VFVDGRYISPDAWYDVKAKTFQPQVHYYVGGATKLYGAALYRLREKDFGELKHPDGVSPAWPIDYSDKESYYTMAEGLYQMRGARGEDPTEPPSTAPYPLPALPHEPRIQQLSDDLAAAGLHPFHAPCGVLRDEDRRSSACASGVAIATGSPARCTRKPTPRCSACAPRSSTPTSACSQMPRRCG
jgi:choline dehydrogenase-like flavoprotein